MHTIPSKNFKWILSLKQLKTNSDNRR
jgi:hypothetical protein